MAPLTNTQAQLLTKPHQPKDKANGSLPQQQQETKERLGMVGVSAKWGIGMSLFNLVYGYLLVATQLPPDPRQNSWLLMQSPLPTYFISLVYVFGVTWLGPRIMEKRKPISGLRPIMVVYNAFQVVYSLWLVYELGMGGWFTTYNLRCETCDFSNNPQAIRMMHASYWYYFSKFVDFLDTVFFVLNKKFEHISLLHVVHHSLMPVSMWYGVRYQPGGHNTFMGLLNSFVHVVMYSYYLLAAMGPRVRPFLWWKKYLTTLQMVQFITVMVHAVQLAFVECPVPAQITWWICGNSIMFLCLFANFYLQSYTSSRRPRLQEKGKSSIPSVRESTSLSKGSRSTSNTILSGVPNGVAETACMTMEMCENMALRSRLGAL